MTIGERLRMIRTKENLLLKEVGNLCGISEQTLSRYERGQRTPDNEFLKEFINHFKVSPDWLYLGQSPIYRDDQYKKREVKEAFIELSQLINAKELPGITIPEKFDFSLQKVTDDNPDNYLLLLKYMLKYPLIRKGIFQFFLFILKPLIDKNPELLQ